MSKEVIIDIENPKDNDLISRQAVKEVFPKWKFISYEAYLCSVLEIDKLPSVSTEKTGYWTKHNTGHSRYYSCSKCSCLAPNTEVADGVIWKLSKYCPDCGAKMIKPKEKSKEWVNFAEDLIPIIDEVESEESDADSN